MTMNELELRQGKRAVARRTERFVSILTYSGRGLLALDLESPAQVLGSDAPSEELGAAVCDALSKSRFLSAEAAQQQLNRDAIKRIYEDWVAQLLKKFEYGSRRALFGKMISCDLVLHQDELTLQPTSHPKLEAWEALEKDKSIVVRGGSKLEIGSALQVAFERCEP